MKLFLGGGGGGRQVKMKMACHDSSSVHIITTASLADLRRRIQESGDGKEYAEYVSTLSFRPNIVVETLEPFAEDRWRSVVVGHNVLLQIRKPAPRCKITCVEPKTGGVNREPLKTLATYRHSQQTKSIDFGIYCVPASEGVIRVGDPVAITLKSE